MKKLLLLALISTNFILSQSFVPNPPDLNLKSYILIDPNTNYVIAESNSDGQIEPASMTKVMTAYVVADQIKNNLISLDDEVLVSEKAWKMGGSKMFIEVGKKVNKGDILVASMTTPDYIPAMKKAAAIITDEGGITCHAAIIAREFNIPCIIGTKNATKTLKDNNIIEVNANNGTITILNSQNN